MIRLLALGASALLLSLTISTQAFAAAYLDTSHALGTVAYTNIGDLNGLFQQPTQNVNTLTFSPNGFVAQCLNGGCGGIDTTTDTVVFRVDANPGNFIDEIMLSESGDFDFDDLPFAGSLAETSVTANVFVDVLEVNGVGVGGVSASAPMVFTSGGNYTLAADGTALSPWSGSLDLDIAQVLVNNGFGPGDQATLIEVSIENTLTATSATGANATIQKKNVSGLSITVVPEPGTALLLGLGLASLASVRSRD